MIINETEVEQVGIISASTNALLRDVGLRNNIAIVLIFNIILFFFYNIFLLIGNRRGFYRIRFNLREI